MSLGLIRAWNVFWFRPVSARPLGAFRVVIGVLALCHLGFLGVDLDHWLTDAGLLVGDEAREMAGPFRPSPLQWVQDPTTVRAAVAATAGAAVLFTVGWHTRVASVLLYLGLLSIHHRNIPTNCGPDNLLLIMVFYLMLGPSGAACSLDARRRARRRGTPAEPVILPWAQRLIQLQLCMIYFDTAVLKCNGSTWLGGTALHYVLTNPEVGRFDLSALCRYPLVLNLLGHAALAVEFALAFLLWFRPTRRYVALLGCALHFGVLFVVNVPLFGELMVASYLTFLDPDELAGLLRAVNPLCWFRPRVEGVAVVPGRVDGAHPTAGPHAGVAVGTGAGAEAPAGA